MSWPLDRFANGGLNVPNVASGHLCPLSVEETLPSVQYVTSSDEESKEKSKRQSFYDLPIRAMRKKEKKNFEKWAFLQSNTCQTNSSNESEKMSSKMRFALYLRKCKVKNDKHYDHLIKTDPTLAELELTCNVLNLKALKAILFYQNTNDKPTLMTDTLADMPTYNDEERRVFDKFFHSFFTVIGRNSDDNLMTVVKKIFDVLDLSDPKVSTLIFIGKANTGKTFCLTFYVLTCPITTTGFYSLLTETLRTFDCRTWLQNIYLCEELCFLPSTLFNASKG